MKRVTSVVLILIVFSGLAFTVRKTQEISDRKHEIRFVDTRPVFLPKGEVLKWLSMGYRGMMADWLWIRSVLYYGRRVMDEDNAYYVHILEKGGIEEELKGIPSSSSGLDSLGRIHEDLKHLLYQGESRGLVDYIYPMLDRVTTVDPHFIFPYIFGGLYVMMDTGEIDEAQALLEKGYKTNPDRWEFPFYLGWIHWMYRNDPERTTRYLLEAVSREGCPPFAGSILAGLSRNLHQKDFATMYLQGIYDSSNNEEIRKQIRQILDRLE